MKTKKPAKKNTTLKEFHTKDLGDDIVAAKTAKVVRPKANSVLFSTGVPEVDSVLGGGIYSDSLVLLGGDRGGGKTTLVLQIANNVAAKGRKVIYVSGEDNTEGLARYAGRLGIKNKNVEAWGIGDFDLTRVLEVKSSLVIIDSAQSVYFDDVNGDAGSLSQVAALADCLNDFVKTKKIPVILVCHLNKNQTDFAGPAVLQFLADACLLLRNEEDVDEHGEVFVDTKGLRGLSIKDKNRLGPNDVAAKLRLTPTGFVSAPKKRKLAVSYIVRDDE